jgi:hypothetical protein
VINPIGQPRFVEPWRRALEQFFRIVRVMDVLQAPFDQQLELLRAFGQMREAWRSPVDEAVVALLEHRARQGSDAARVIAEMIAEAITQCETRDIGRAENAAPHTAAMEEEYRRHLRRIESVARQEVEAIYGFDELDREEVDMRLLDTDLLSRESWLAFGLKKRDLVVVSAAGGAVVGGVIDSALLGASFLAGSVVGGLIGGAVGYFSSDRLADIKVLRQPLGGVRLRVGPSRNLQFPFVLLHRAILHHSVVAGRTHAQRGVMKVTDMGDSGPGSGRFEGESTRELARLFERLRRSDPGSESRAAALVYLTEIISKVTAFDEGREDQ